MAQRPYFQIKATLSELGVKGSVISWLHSYLHKRKQHVVINGVESTRAFLEAGVPHCSILGPLLFLVYVSDITDGIESDINLFADDTYLLQIVDDPTTSANILNADLDRLHQWASQWLVTFNPNQTEVITFSAKTKKPYHPPLLFSGIPLKEVSHYTHLGLTFLSDLTWTNHIKSVVRKASKRVGIMKRLKYTSSRTTIMKRLKYTLSRTTIMRLYTTLVRPILEYGCVIFDACSQLDSQLIELFQYDAARVCTSAIWNTNRVSILHELGWEMLETRRKLSKSMLLLRLEIILLPPICQIKQSGWYRMYTTILFVIHIYLGSQE